MKKIKPYTYIIIKHNDPYFAQQSTLLENKYDKSKKYAFIEKSVYKDGSEGIVKIKYSNDLELFQIIANKYISWYNYPLNLSKNIQGYIKNIE